LFIRIKDNKVIVIISLNIQSFIFRYWWRRGESNPRPQVLDFRLYVRSPLFVSRAALPEGQGKAKRQRTVTLNDPARRTSDREPVNASPESAAQARTGRRSAAVRRRERSCRRWQLWFCSVIYEGTAPRYAPEGSQPTSKPASGDADGPSHFVPHAISNVTRNKSAWRKTKCKRNHLTGLPSLPSDIPTDAVCPCTPRERRGFHNLFEPDRFRCLVPILPSSRATA
jgi:hypothetical protein